MSDEVGRQIGTAQWGGEEWGRTSEIEKCEKMKKKILEKK